MAKEKIKKITEEEFTDFDSLAKALSGSFDNSETFKETPEYYLDTGFLPLNKAITGKFELGIRNGIVVEISGAESSGKSAIATNLMVAAQKKGGVAIFMDHEYSFDMHLGERLGLNTKAGKFFYKQPLTAEESVDAIRDSITTIREKGLPKSKPIVAVLDSWAMAIPQQNILKKTSDQNMNDNTALARLANVVFPKLKQCAKMNNALIIILNQQRKKFGVLLGNETVTPGGDAKNFAFDLRLKLTRAMLKDSSNNKTGQIITCECFKNKIGVPYKKTKWNYLFEGGGKFDTIGSTVDYMKEQGILKTSGAFIEWNGVNRYRNYIVKELEENGGVEVLNKMILSKSMMCGEEVVPEIQEEVEE